MISQHQNQGELRAIKAVLDGLRKLLFDENDTKSLHGAVEVSVSLDTSCESQSMRGPQRVD